MPIPSPPVLPALQSRPPNQKQANTFLHHIYARPHVQEQFQQLLSKFSHLHQEMDQQLLQLNEKFSINVKKQASKNMTDLCAICYNELSWKKNWCRVCGNFICQNCQGRQRVLGQGQKPVCFCETCDRKYLVAMMEREGIWGLQVGSKAVEMLMGEKDGVQFLLKIERESVKEKHKEEGENLVEQARAKAKAALIAKMNRVTQLNIQKDDLKSEILELKKKVQWGLLIKGQLQKKLKKARRSTMQSFCSSVNQDESWAPPKVEHQADELSVQNLNQSILINSIMEPQENKQMHGQNMKCTCDIF